MSEQTQRDIIRARVARRLRRRERWLARRDSDDEDSGTDDESSSPAAAASTESASSSSSSATISLPASRSASPTSSSSIESSSAAPTALPIVESSTTPILVSSSSSTRISRTSLATGVSSTTPFDVTALLPSRTAIAVETNASSSNSGMETRIAIGAGVTSAAVVILGLLACFCLRKRYKKRRSAQLESQSNMSEYDQEPLPLMRGALGPTSFWQPWKSTRSLPRQPTRSMFARSFVTRSWVSDDDQDRLVANGMRPASVASRGTNNERRGWYSVFSGSDRIISILSPSQRKSSATLAGTERNEKTWPAPALREDQASMSDAQAPRIRSMRQSNGSRFIESRFYARDSAAPANDDLYSRDSIVPPNQARQFQSAFRTSSALEREYLSMPVPSGLRNSTAASESRMSSGSTLQPPALSRDPARKKLGSLSS